MKRIFPFFLVGLLFLFQPPPLVASLKPAPSSIRSIDFRNFTYPLPDKRFSELGKKVRVVDGTCDDGSNQMCRAYFHVAEVIYGDLTGDQHEEAVVVTIFGSACGTYYLTNIYVYSLVNRKPLLLAQLKESQVEEDFKKTYRGDKYQLFESVESGRLIKNKQLTVSYFTTGAHCCPENVSTFRYELRGKKMVLIQNPKRVPNSQEYVKMQAYHERLNYLKF
ncbi:MAG: hypothetical protein HY774_07830 [Acidobacteria bacterium]|nr:hypothetical protein [Acidobacteriota bacterium]